MFAELEGSAKIVLHFGDVERARFREELEGII